METIIPTNLPAPTFKGVVLMSTDKKATIADAVSKDWLDKKEFADEIDTSVNNLQQYLANGIKAKKFPKPGPQYMQKAVRHGKKVNVYSPQYVEMVGKTREGLASAKKGASKSALHRAILVIKVPVFDQSAAKYLLKKFSNEAGLEKFLYGKLEEVYKPLLSKRAELEEKHRREMAELEQGNL